MHFLSRDSNKVTIIIQPSRFSHGTWTVAPHPSSFFSSYSRGCVKLCSNGATAQSWSLCFSTLWGFFTLESHWCSCGPSPQIPYFSFFLLLSFSFSSLPVEAKGSRRISVVLSHICLWAELFTFFLPLFSSVSGFEGVAQDMYTGLCLTGAWPLLGMHVLHSLFIPASWIYGCQFWCQRADWKINMSATTGWIIMNFHTFMLPRGWIPGGPRFQQHHHKPDFSLDSYSKKNISVSCSLCKV